MPDQPRFKQTGRRLEIHTVLDGLEADPDIDPLLLVYVKGTEEISQPFSYTVKMWRLVDDQNRPPLPPGDMINIRAAIHINLKETVEVGEASPSQDDPNTDTVSEVKSHVRRCGVFETFNDDGTILGETETVLGQTFRVRQYSGTVVPAFKMMAYETAYRVFENKNAVQIIHEVTDRFPHFRLNDDRLNNTFFPKMPYCVQFGESTFNFLSRLMAQFGIWYYFDHDLETEDISTMILGAGPSNFDKCKVSGRELLADHPIHQLTEITNKDLEPSALTIKNFQRVYAPMTRRARFGNFNILDPADPITNFANVQAARDLIVPPQTVTQTKGGSRVEPDDDDRFRTEVFAAPVELNNDPISPSGPDAPNAQAYARQWMRSNEAIVAKVSGSTRNIAFMPGFAFDRVNPQFKSARDGEDLIGQEDKDTAAAGSDILVFQNPALRHNPVITLGSYVLVKVEFEGLETSYAEEDDFGTILRNILFPPNFSVTDVLANTTAEGINNYLQNSLPIIAGQPTAYPGQSPNPPPYFFPYFLGGGLASVTGLIPLIVQAIEKAFEDKKASEFHCSFSAVPLDGLEYQGDGHPKADAPLLSLPLPSSWTKPVASGPHLAVVIGQDGTNTDQHEIFADSIGRVRVRFPWDRKPKEKPGDSFKRGSDACWVRVSEGWAGRQFGTQFLPRIGQEVIVDFIAGDPDRPIITGRVYNADRGFANMPFPEGQVDVELVEQKDLYPPIPFTDFRFAGLKTCSMPNPAPQARPRYHLTRFDDTLNCEQYLLRSQGRLDVTAFAHSFATTHGNRHVQVTHGRDKDNRPFGGSAFTTVGGEYDLHIGDSRYEGVDKGYQLTVKTDTIFDLEANHTTIVGASSKLNAKEVVIEAPIKITLKVGSSFIVLDPAGVWIQGPLVNINSGGAPGVTADVDVTDPTDASAAEPGDQWNKRTTTCDPHPAGGGGGRRHHTAHARHGLAVTANPDGSLQVGPGIRVAGGNAAYKDAVVNDLATMDQTPAGHALVQNLDSSGHTTTIQPRPAGSTPAATGTGYANEPASRAPGTPGTTDAAGNPLPGAGTGSNSTINYNPSDWPLAGTRTNPPSDVGLFHEMTHADHAAHGTRDRTPRADGWGNQEEFNTIQDENAYRNQRGPWPGMPADNQRHDHTLGGA
jgi:uncharacterized protein involved in type VI secretion and phage assembly